MADFIIAPNGTDAIETGTLIDDDGARFALMRFRNDDGDTVSITMNIPLFRAYAEQLGKMADLTGSEKHWLSHART